MRYVRFAGTLHVETKIYVDISLKQFNALNYSHTRATEEPKAFAFVNYQNVWQRLETVDDFFYPRFLDWSISNRRGVWLFLL